MYKKIKSLFLGAALFSMLFAPALLSNLTHALAIQELTPEYATGSKIEFNTPEEGYSFDVTFLAQNQNLTYKTTLQNDGEQTIVITSLDLQTPTADYLQYSFDGIAAGDELAPGDSKEITIQISSNNNDTHTTAEDFKFSIHYHTVNPTPNDEPENPEEPLDVPDTNAPDTGANHEGKTNAKNTNQITFFIVVAIASIILLVILLSNKKVKNLHAIVAVISLSLSFFIIGGIVVAEKDEVYTITGKVRFTNVYSISIDPGAGLYNGETGVHTIECRDGERITISDPTYATYNFTGWATNPQTTFETDENGNRILVANNHYELSAQWDEIYYNLTIDPNGGTYNGQTGVQVLPIRVGTTASLVTPEKTGMTFANWTKTIGNTTETITDMSVVVEEDLTLTANYEDIYYDIVINPNGGTYKGSTASTTEHVKYGTELTIVDPSYDTYTFAGWDISPSASMSGSTIAAYDNYTLTAQWEEIYFNLTINPNGGTYDNSTEIQTIPYRAGATAQISTPSKTGATFSNWTKTIGSASEAFTGASISMTSDVSLTANYEDIYFDVTINPNGGLYKNSTETVTEHVKYGTELTIPNPTYDTYRFAGWNIAPSTTMNETTLVVYDNYTLTAQWEEIYYTLTINPNGGLYNNSTETQELLYRAGTTIEDIATPQKEGMTFTNWTKTIGDSSETFTGTSLTINSDITLLANYEDLYFDVTVNPNGGKFNNSTEVYSTSIKYGSTLDLTSIERENYTLTNWTMNTNDSLPSGTNSIQIYSNLTLVANWAEIAYYTITINPNSGNYAGTTEPTIVSNVQNYTTFNLEEASYDGYAFQYWEVTSGTVNTAINGELTSNSFIVLDDVTLTAHWGRTVARIERTQQIYGSIMAAEGVAQKDDIITLLVDTEETVTNDKKVTLDLNNHTVTGSLTNTTSGNITIINGEINNPSGAAVINNGTLTLGVDDYNDDGTANILNDNIRLVGTTAGLMQTNDVYKFYYYDGYLEGDSGLVGGYDGSPFYRNTFDDVIVYFYPVVNHVEQGGRTYQHVELESSDRAVSKTSVHGDIYYYNLQDNINTSAVTGYKIYAVRDFEAGYTITVPNDVSVVIDTAGHKPTINDTVTINGTLRIEDSTTRISGGTNENSYTGQFRVTQSIANSGLLEINEAIVTSTSQNDTIVNHGTVKIRGGTLGATNGYVFKTTADGIYDLDEKSYIKSSKTAIYNNTSDYVWDTAGNVVGSSTGIENKSSITIKNGTVRGSTAMTGGRITIDGGNIIGSNHGITCNQCTLTMNGGTLKGSQTGVLLYTWGDFFMNGGTVEASIGVRRYSGNLVTFTMTGGTINATTYGVQLNEGTWAIKGGKVHGGVYGAYSMDDESPITIGEKDNTVSATNPEITGGKYALYGGAFKYYDGILRGTEHAFQDGIIQAMPEGKKYHIEESDEYTENCWLVDHENYLQVGDEEFNTLYGAYGAITGDTGTITVIRDIEALTDLSESPSNKNITFDLNGHQITYAQPLVNNSNMTITDSNESKTGKITSINTTLAAITNKSTLTIDSGEYAGRFRAITNNGTVILNDGTIKLTDDAVGFSTAIYGGHMTINGGQVLSDNTAIERTWLTMNGGTVRSTITGRVSGQVDSVDDCDIVMNDGLIEILSSQSTSSATAVRARYYNGITINGGTIRAETSGQAAAYYAEVIEIDKNGSITMNGGTLEAVSGTGIAQAIRSLDGTPVTINGGTIIATGGGSGNKYGVTGNYSNGFTIKGGEIHATNTGSGNAYGFYVEAGNVTIGTNDTTVSTTIPEITGKTSALHGPAFFFFDGILRGKTGADGDIIKAIPDGYKYHIEASDEYAENCWLEEAEKYLSVDDVEYSSFSAAYNAITGDTGTIKLIADTTIEAELPGSPTGKNITFDLNGHQLTHSQPIINNGTMTFIDSSENQTGKLYNSNTAAASIKNNATLIIESGYYNGEYRVIENTGTVTVNGGTIASSKTGIYSSGTYNQPSTVNLVGGVITNTNATNAEQIGIELGNYTTVNITTGQIVIENDVTVTNTYYDLYGIKGSGTVNIESAPDHKAIIMNNTGGGRTGLTGIRESTLHFKSGIIEITSNSDSYSIVAVNGSMIMDGGTMNLTGNAYVTGATGCYTHTLNGGTINATSNRTNTSGSVSAVGISTSKTSYCSPTTTINGGTINATGTNGSNAVGVSTGEIAKIVVNGGNINAIAEGTGTGTGLSGSAKDGLITGGRIFGTTNGVSKGWYTLTIGQNDGTVSTTTPEIIGGQYGIAAGRISFYDGVLKGGETAFAEGVIRTIADNTAFTTDSETIGEGEEAKTYEVKYLSSEYDVAEINDTKYTKLSSAIQAANIGDTIKLITDNYLFYDLTIPAEKEITIDTNGYNLFATSSITNNGKLTITNSKTETNRLTLSFKESRFFVNNAGAELNIDNIDFNTTNSVFYNYGTINLSNLAITTPGRAIENHGNLTATNVQITILPETSSSYGTTYNSAYGGSECDSVATFENVTIDSGSIYVNGSLTVNNSTFNNMTFSNYTCGVTSITSSTFTNHNRGTSIIGNQGALTIVDSTVTLNNDAYTGSGVRSVIGNSSSTATIESINTTYNLFDTASYAAYAINNDSGTFTMKSGSVNLSNAYVANGIYNNKGTVILGTPEDPSSPNYGLDTADVSTEIPEIKVTSTRNDGGIGVKNNTGRFYFYDGKIMGTSKAMAESPSGTEYLYEVKDYTDENGYKVRTLEWMRQQP